MIEFEEFIYALICYENLVSYLVFFQCIRLWVQYMLPSILVCFGTTSAWKGSTDHRRRNDVLSIIRNVFLWRERSSPSSLPPKIISCILIIFSSPQYTYILFIFLLIANLRWRLEYMTSYLSGRCCRQMGSISVVC